MKTPLKLTFLAVFGLGCGLAFAQANPGATLDEPTFNCTAGDGSESTYEIWLYTSGANTQWDAAQAFAETRGPSGQANLAVFLDATEEQCVLDAAKAAGLGFNQQLWIGLRQELSASEPAGGWGWVTGESLSAVGAYVNWGNGEPNDASPGEDHGTIGRYGYDLEDGWNDEAPTRSSLVGFLVEISNTSDAQNCLEDQDGVPDGEFGIGGCNPSGYQIVELPDNLDGLLDGKTITQNAVKAKISSAACNSELVGPDVRVNQIPSDPDFGMVMDNRPLDLSEVFHIPAGVVVLRADTVGSPCLALLEGTSNFQFKDLVNALPNGGTATVTQLPGQVPGMFTLPEVGTLDEQGDLTFVPQAAYQTRDRFLLIENAASPFTNDVFNPSRQKTFQFSFYPLNTREVCLFIDPSLSPEDPDGGAAYFQAVYECKIDLAVEYFDALEQALFEAEPNLISPKFSDFSSKLNQARAKIKNAQWDAARTRLGALLDEVQGATWTVDDRNDPGNLEMRLDNLLWRIDQLEQAGQALN